MDANLTHLSCIGKIYLRTKYQYQNYDWKYRIKYFQFFCINVHTLCLSIFGHHPTILAFKKAPNCAKICNKKAQIGKLGQNFAFSMQ